MCLTRQEDILLWPKSRDGMYLVKVGYQRLCGMEDREEASGFSSEEIRKF